MTVVGRGIHQSRRLRRLHHHRHSDRHNNNSISNKELVIDIQHLLFKVKHHQQEGYGK